MQLKELFQSVQCIGNLSMEGASIKEMMSLAMHFPLLFMTFQLLFIYVKWILSLDVFLCFISNECSVLNL